MIAFYMLLILLKGHLHLLFPKTQSTLRKDYNKIVTSQTYKRTKREEGQKWFQKPSIRGKSVK